MGGKSTYKKICQLIDDLAVSNHPRADVLRRKVQHMYKSITDRILWQEYEYSGDQSQAYIYRKELVERILNDECEYKLTSEEAKYLNQIASKMKSYE